MTLADVLAVVFGLAIAGAGFACLSVILRMLLPATLERAGARAVERPGRSAGLGLLTFFGSLIVWGALLKVPSTPARLAAIVSILCGLSLAVLGAAALAIELGRRSAARANETASLRDLLRGVFLLEGAALFPIVGWFVVFPSAFLICLGSGVQAVFGRRAHVAVPAPSVGA